MASPVWLLDLRAGQTWRLATRRVEWDGHEYADGLEDPGSLELGLSFSVPQEASQPITVHAQQVHDLDTEDVARGATGTLYYWHDPAGVDDPIVVVDGVVEDPEYGGRDEPLTFSLTEVPWADRGRLPAFGAQINDDTWPNRDYEVGIDDEWYPLIIGAPGLTDGDVVGSPAYFVDIGTPDLILVAGHPVVSVTVDLYEMTGPSTLAGATITTTTDGRGRQVAVVDVSTWGTIAVGNEYWALWSGVGGGLANPNEPDEALTGAGDVIEYLLHRSSIRVDWGRIRAARHALNAYKIDTYIQSDPEERLRPWDWITEHLLPILPVSVRTGPGGLYLVVFDPATPPSEVRGRLEAGRNCDRISPVSVTGTSDIANDYAISYAPRADKDKGTLSRRLTGDPETLAAFSDAVPSGSCRESVRRFGVTSREVSTTVVYDTPTATRILASMAARDSLPVKEVAFAVDDDLELRVLEPGDAVLLTDSTLGWTDRVAYVWTVRVAAEREITLRLWTIPGRD